MKIGQQAFTDRFDADFTPAMNQKLSKTLIVHDHLDGDSLQLDSSNGNAHSSSGEAYHWDCSDWVRRSHNPLPNITEVPGSEVPDSSSFHSNESNESQCKQLFLPQSKFE